MITEDDLFLGREMARRRQSRYSSPLKELLFAVVTGFGAAVGMILTVIYADKIDAFFSSVLKFIWL